MILSIILFLLSAVFEAVMDFLQFRYTKRNQFWNPQLSWMNKWDFSKVPRKERFPLSSTVLVFLTDGWHLMKWCRNRCLDGVMFVLTFELTGWWLALIITIAIRTLYGVIFEFIFRKIR
jgi:hypothetical protein